MDVVERLRLEASERAKDPEWFDEDFSKAIVAAADEIESLHHASEFLIARLDDFERDALQEDDGEYVLRQFDGHVSPAIEGLRAALQPEDGWMSDVKRKRGRPKIHPDRKAYQAEWARKKRAKEKGAKAP